MPSITNKKENNFVKYVNNDLTFITNEDGKSLKDRFDSLIKDSRFFDVLDRKSVV